VYYAHALRIHLLKGRIPAQIKSAYTNEWYADIPTLPDHPLRRQSHVIDRDWDMESQESHESSTSVDLPTAHKRKRRRQKRQRTMDNKHVIPPVAHGPHQYPSVPLEPQ
jgi:hypothetical protein